MKLVKFFDNISWLQDGAVMSIWLKSKDEKIPDSIIGKSTSVFAFIFDKNKENIIVLEHTDKKRGYDIAGGHIEDGESNLEALHREVLE